MCDEIRDTMSIVERTQPDEPVGLGDPDEPYDIEDFDPDDELLELPFCNEDDPSTLHYDERTGDFRMLSTE